MTSSNKNSRRRRRNWRSARAYALPTYTKGGRQWLRLHRPLPLVAEFCNTSPDATTIAWFTNDLRVEDDGWAMLAPYGDFPGLATVENPDDSVSRLRAIQRITREDVAQMVNGFKSVTGRIKRFLRGVPIFVGHPDAPGIGDRWPDKNAKGTIADLDARETGLFCRPVFTNDGINYLDQHTGIGFSARWTAKPDGESAGIPVFRPVTLMSAGLTDNPNLPVELLNEADAGAIPPNDTQDLMERTKLMAGLKKLGLELANDASDTQIESALTALGEKLAASASERDTARNELANSKAALATITAERDSARTELKTAKASATALTTERDAARTELSNERAARIGLKLDTAILSGRITVAERPKHEEALKADFANASTALDRLPQRIKVTSVLGDISARKAEIANDSPVGKFRSLVRKHTEAGKSKAESLNLAIQEAPDIYREFLNAGCADLQL